METPEGMDPAAFEKLLKEYKEAIPEKIKTLKSKVEAMKTSYQKEDLEQVSFIIHKFAGNAGMYGYLKVTQICKELDTRIKSILKDSEFRADANFLNDLEAQINTIEKEFEHG